MRLSYDVLRRNCGRHPTFVTDVMEPQSVFLEDGDERGSV